MAATNVSANSRPQMAQMFGFVRGTFGAFIGNEGEVSNSAGNFIFLLTSLEFRSKRVGLAGNKRELLNCFWLHLELKLTF